MCKLRPAVVGVKLIREIKKLDLKNDGDSDAALSDSKNFKFGPVACTINV
jgi:hypothetical protein